MKSKVISKHLRKNEHGGTLVLVTVFMIALFAFSALSIDVGNVLVHRSRIQEASDSAALAAVVTWAKDKDVTLTQTVGTNYEASHGVQANEVVSVTTGRWDDSTKSFIAATTLSSTDVPAVEVIANRTVDLAFAPIIGMDNMTPRVRSVAVVAAATQVFGAVPWGVCGDGWTPSASCTTTTLQNDNNSCGGPGNFGALALGADGASTYEGNIVNGYDGVLTVGQIVETETGQMVGPTMSGVGTKLANANNPYINCSSDNLPDNDCNGSTGSSTGCMIVVPKIETIPGEPENGKHKVKIAGFLTFNLDSVTGGGNVTATYVDSYSGQSIDPSAPPIPGGLNGVGLVQ